VVERFKNVLLVLAFLFTKTVPGFGTPALTSVSPSSGIQGATLNLTLTGSGFSRDTTVALSGTGVVINGVRVKHSFDDTSIGRHGKKSRRPSLSSPPNRWRVQHRIYSNEYRTGVVRKSFVSFSIWS